MIGNIGFYLDQLCFSIVSEELEIWCAFVQRERGGELESLLIMGAENLEILKGIIQDFLDADEGDGHPDEKYTPDFTQDFIEALAQAVRRHDRATWLRDFLSGLFVESSEIEEVNGCKIRSIHLRNGSTLYLVFDPNGKFLGATTSKERALQLAYQFGYRPPWTLRLVISRARQFSFSLRVVGYYRVPRVRLEKSVRHSGRCSRRSGRVVRSPNPRCGHTYGSSPCMPAPIRAFLQPSLDRRPSHSPLPEMGT